MNQDLDTTDCFFSELFAESPFPWHALSLLKKYFSHLSLGKIDTEVPEGCVLINPELISIGEGTTLEPGSTIIGPCFLGKHCQVRQGAYLRGFVLAEDSCVLGHATEVKHSIFFKGAQAAHFGYVGDSILGNRVNLGAGTRCANLRLDRKNVKITFEGHRRDSGLRKLGAILGDHCQIGCNVVLSPGTLLGKNVQCYPCIHVYGTISRDSIVKSAKHFSVEEI